MASQITGVSVVNSIFVQAQIKENTKAPRHWPLWGGSTGWPVKSPFKGQETRNIFPFHDVIMKFPLPALPAINNLHNVNGVHNI